MLLTIKDVAERLAVTTKTVQRLYRKNEFPPIVKIGRLVRFTEEDIDNYIDAKRRGIKFQNPVSKPNVRKGKK